MGVAVNIRKWKDKKWKVASDKMPQSHSPPLHFFRKYLSGSSEFRWKRKWPSFFPKMKDISIDCLVGVGPLGPRAATSVVGRAGEARDASVVLLCVGLHRA
jgi:hypothetical protein